MDLRIPCTITGRALLVIGLAAASCTSTKPVTVSSGTRVPESSPSVAHHRVLFPEVATAIAQGVGPEDAGKVQTETAFLDALRRSGFDPVAPGEVSSEVSAALESLMHESTHSGLMFTRRRKVRDLPPQLSAIDPASPVLMVAVRLQQKLNVGSNPAGGAYAGERCLGELSAVLADGDQVYWSGHVAFRSRPPDTSAWTYGVVWADPEFSDALADAIDQVISNFPSHQE